MSPIPPTEGDAYREQLSAALARIDALEAELAGRAGAARGAAGGRVEELERQRRELLESAEPKKLRRVALTLFAVPPALFSVMALVVWLAGKAGPALGALPIMGLAMGGLIGLIHLLVTPSSTRQVVAKLDVELAEARRFDALEAEVRETRRLLQAGAAPAQTRVAADEADAEEPEPPRARRGVEK